MRSLADSIQAVCDVMTEGDPAPSAKAATEQEPVKEPDIPLEKVRMVLAERARLDLPPKCEDSFRSMVQTS